MISVSVTHEDFDAGAEIATLGRLGGGGIASFVGVVRGGDGLIDLHLDHYPGMTEAKMQALAEEAGKRFDLLGVRVIHRVGTLPVGAQIVFVGTAARHRTAALEATAYLIDWLKTDAPFWKRERYADGRISWVEARHEDDAKAAKWER
jgi:molybdopterin synthase catalytic subunit